MSSHRPRYRRSNAILQKIKHNPSYIQNVQNQDEEMCIEAVSRNGLTLFFVQDKTPDVCQTAVLENPHALNFVDDPPYELCKLAISEDGLCIQFVERDTFKKFSDEQTNNLCITAVKQNGGALKFIPIEYHTGEVCMEAIKNDPTMLKEINGQNEEMCIEAVSLNPEVLIYVKDQTPNVLKAALAHPNFTQNFIDFKKFKISSIKNVDTGEVYTLDNVDLEDFDDKDNEKKTMIYFKDIRKDKIMYVNNLTSIQDELENFIRQKYGKKCLEKAQAYFTNRDTLDTIRMDDTFDEGAFFFKLDDENYELWLKTTTYSQSWWSGKTRTSNVQKIRTYSVIEEEQVIQ